MNFIATCRLNFKRKKLPQEKQKRSLKGNSSFRQDSNPCIPDTGQQLSATNWDTQLQVRSEANSIGFYFPISNLIAIQKK